MLLPGPVRGWRERVDLRLAGIYVLAPDIPTLYPEFTF